MHGIIWILSNAPELDKSYIFHWYYNLKWVDLLAEFCFILWLESMDWQWSTETDEEGVLVGKKTAAQYIALVRNWLVSFQSHDHILARQAPTNLQSLAWGRKWLVSCLLKRYLSMMRLMAGLAPMSHTIQCDLDPRSTLQHIALARKWFVSFQSHDHILPVPVAGKHPQLCKVWPGGVETDWSAAF